MVKAGKRYTTAATLVEAEFEYALTRTEALRATPFSATTEVAFGQYLLSVGEQARAAELFAGARVRADSCGANGVHMMIAAAEASQS